jgi:anoctamin-10
VYYSSWTFTSVKDWLYGIRLEQPRVGGKNTTVNAAFESEDVLSMYHLVTWSKELGGAGITPGFKKWENVKSIFPLQNNKTNEALLMHLSKRIFLGIDDFDKIRDVFGVKVLSNLSTRYWIIY